MVEGGLGSASNLTLMSKERRCIYENWHSFLSGCCSTQQRVMTKIFLLMDAKERMKWEYEDWCPWWISCCVLCRWCTPSPSHSCASSWTSSFGTPWKDARVNELVPDAGAEVNVWCLRSTRLDHIKIYDRRMSPSHIPLANWAPESWALVSWAPDSWALGPNFTPWKSGQSWDQFP